MKINSVILFLIVFPVLSMTAFAQALDSDSLLNEIRNQNDREVRAQNFFLLGDAYFLTDNDTSIFYFKQAYRLAKQTKDVELLANVTGRLGSAYQYTDPAKSSHYVLESVQYAEKSKDPFLITYTHNLLGNLYRLNGEYDKAMKEYKYCLKVAKGAKDTLQMARAFNAIGIIHMIQADYDKGLAYWKDALDLKLQLGEESSAAATMSNIGLYYKDIGRYFEAKEYLDRSLQINLKYRDYQAISFDYTIIGDMHWRMGNYRKAIPNYKKSLDYSDSNGTYLDKEEAFIGLARVLDSLGRYKEALKYHKKYTDLIIERYSEQNSRITRELTTKFETDKKEKENLLLRSKNEAKDAKIALEEANNRYLMWGLSLAFVVLILIGYILNRVRQAKKETEKQKHIVEEKNREITDSISYAKRLQDAMLPTNEAITEELNDNFVLYKPKDIVAGDFYWMEKKNDLTLLAVADCTGHGVPGAMVSVVCNNALNRAVREFGLTDPGKILDKVTDLVIETFDRSQQEVKDGMDICLCVFDQANELIRFSGANNGLYCVSNGELTEIKPTKQPVGKYANRKEFETHEVNYKKGDCFYMFTDGFADQFGGPKGKKFKYKPFKKLLLENHDQDVMTQLNHLNQAFEDWKNGYEQVDDVCVIGVRI